MNSSSQVRSNSEEGQNTSPKGKKGVKAEKESRIQQRMRRTSSRKLEYIVPGKEI